MRGSIARHGPSWSYRIPLSRDPTTHKRRQLRRSGYPTRRAAEQAMAEAVAELGRGEHVRPARNTVGEYLAGWLTGQAAHLRPTTLYAYRKTVRQRIVPALGSVRLAELDAAMLEAWYGDLLTHGGRGGTPLAAKTVANTAGVLSAALSDAVRLRQLRYNPAKTARLPRREPTAATVWTADEATTFLAAVSGDRWYPLWRLALTTGLRRGELCGLRWRDLDLTTGRLDVVETRVVAEHELVGRPKTRAGERTVALDPDTVVELRLWRRQVAADQLAAGPAWEDTGRVFVDQLGIPPHPETVTRWWGEACDRAGVRRIRLHDARHTAATLALRAGVPVKVVSQRLGHADIAVTLRVYQNVTALDDQQAADTLGRLLGGEQ